MSSDCERAKKMEGIRVKELCMKFLQMTPDCLKIFLISENNVYNGSKIL